MMQQVKLMKFSLNMVDYSMSLLSLSTWDSCCTSRGDHSEPFLLFEFFGGDPTFMLKSYRVGWSQSLCGGARVYVVEPESIRGARVYVKEPESMWGARVYVVAHEILV